MHPREKNILLFYDWSFHLPSFKILEVNPIEFLEGLIIDYWQLNIKKQLNLQYIIEFCWCKSNLLGVS